MRLTPPNAEKNFWKEVIYQYLYSASRWSYTAVSRVVANRPGRIVMQLGRRRE